MPASIFKGSKVKTLKDTFTVNDKYDLITGDSDDPRSVAKDAPLGSEYVKADTGQKFKKLDNGSTTNWAEITGGAGGINYITNPDCEGGTTVDWATYDDGAVAAPVDGTGGTPTNLTFTANTSTELRGDFNFRITKAAADAQGEGASTDLVIDEADKFKSLQVSFEYRDDGGAASNYVTGYLKAYIYDVDNATLIGPVTNDEDGDILFVGANVGIFTGVFTATDSLNYRLIFHCTTINADAWILDVDNVKVGPPTFQPVVVQKSQIIDMTGSGDFTGGSIQIERVGDIVSVCFLSALTHASSGSPGGAAGVIPDWARPASLQSNMYVKDASADIVRTVSIDNLGNLEIRYRNSAGGLVLQTDSLAGAGITYPIDSANGGINVVSNSEITQKTIKAELHLSSDQAVATAAQTEIAFNDSLYDTHSGVDLANNRYIVQKSGYYKVNASVYGINITQDERVGFAVLVNGSTSFIDVFRAQLTDFSSSMGKTVFLEQGDLITVTIDSTVDASFTVRGAANGIYTFLSIESVPDFTTYGVTGENNRVQTKILTADVVTNGDIAQLQFNNLVIGKWYEVSGRIYLSVNDGAVDTTAQVDINHDGSVIDRVIWRSNNGTSTIDFITLPVSTKFQATATTLTFNANSMSASSYVEGTNANRSGTYIQLEERNDLVSTTAF